jgi:hypothetical protein
MIIGLSLEEAILRLLNLHEHVHYLNAVMGCGKGMSVVVAIFLSVAQVISALMTVVILSSFVNMEMKITAFVLGSAVMVEMILYRGFANTELIEITFMTLTALCLSVLLRDTQKLRRNAVNVVLHGKPLFLEASLRKFCTIIHARQWCLIFTVLSLLKAWLYDRYWFKTGPLFEMHRTTFRACVARSATLLLIACEDKSPPLFITIVVERCATMWYFLRRKKQPERKKTW